MRKSLIKDEGEFLYTAYSAFVVEHVEKLQAMYHDEPELALIEVVGFVSVFRSWQNSIEHFKQI